MKISFDFDGTLSTLPIQHIARDLVNSGNDVWVITARFNDEKINEHGHHYGYTGNNNDLREVCEKTGISLRKIIYTNGSNKTLTYMKHKFELHFDDLWEEVEYINRAGGTAVLVGLDVEKIKSDLYKYEF